MIEKTMRKIGLMKVDVIDITYVSYVTVIVPVISMYYIHT